MAKPLMIQGTMSNAGKSLLVAGLARVLVQDGVRVAPFKSQNMALNSFVTKDGCEMGRAQAMQAEAAGIEPDVAMNPILLKPEGARGSQVIVNGRATGTMPAREYFAYRRSLIPTIRAAYDTLAANCDVVLVEGAGSPAEINLQRDDIVNMGLARLLDAPVVLVGDIDPGGVFAQLYGTVALLDETDRTRVRGLVANKFRGDVSILKPGLRPLEELCGAPVLGVVPYLDIDVDDEDSLSSRLSSRGHDCILDVAVIRLPHLSNFTDFDPLMRHPAVGVRYVTQAEELGRPDLAILPGTKSTLADLSWLRSSGVAACVLALAGQGTPVLGICGGYQMLGERIDDPLAVEGGGSARGLGLLSVRTAFAAEKHLMQTEITLHPGTGAFSCWDGLVARGYEIHAGDTQIDDAPAASVREADGVLRPHGAVRGDVLGTYLHGLFDEDCVVDALVAQLLHRRGLPVAAARPASDARAYKERQYDKLADAVRASIDMDAVYRIIEQGA
ncbi:cobyric acid synthase [Collinsella tanakaei]|uniref:cobyric acid synthase n=1 Tax=Collinsella tanakaei TaxID=626935 RepID=UPI0025A3F24E|nr:cobyric acid synthase [Collinsella tanakaei]MDM8245729.1 cobyric acid synthase [Collinsella tanakaei]